MFADEEHIAAAVGIDDLHGGGIGSAEKRRLWLIGNIHNAFSVWARMMKNFHQCQIQNDN
jgi:hypothetical protein